VQRRLPLLPIGQRRLALRAPRQSPGWPPSPSVEGEEGGPEERMLAVPKPKAWSDEKEGAERLSVS